MFEEESIWIKNEIAKISKEINNVLDVGSSTLEFRTKIQPSIDENIFKPLRLQGKKICYLDIKKDKGVNIVCGIENINTINKKFDLVICANLLEHVRDVKKTVNNLKSLISPKGYLLVTVPHFYFYHPAPIDTMYRPDNKSLEELFSFQVISSKIIKIKRLYILTRLHYLGKMILSLPSGVNRYFPYLFKKFQISCVLFKNNNSIYDSEKTSKMKIVYITAKIPWGGGETFVLEEMLELKRQGINLLIIPRNPPKEIFHKDTKGLLKNAFWLPLINLKIIFVFLYSFLIKKSLWKILSVFLKESRNYRIFIKNLAVFPKAVFIAKIIEKAEIQHIHAHWGSTTSTMAFIVSQITGIPWSFTLHRWDIAENNLLKEKLKSTKFARIISEHGKNELLGIIGKSYEDKIKVLYMGVKIPEIIPILNRKQNFSEFKIAVPANLVEKKGHKYLIEAFSSLLKEGVRNFQCFFYGEGSLRNQLENLINERGLKDYIKMPGIFPHEELIKMYENKDIDLVVLPSIITEKGELEGIPVALMEAMAYCIPVISTNTGGIPELLSNGVGIMVEEKNSQQLALAIKKLIENENIRKKIGRQGYKRVCKEFNIQKNIEKLLELFEYYS